jgi:hypothetical protein
MNNEMTQMSFDYTLLDEDKRVRIQVKTEAIKGRFKRTAEDIIAIGQDLIDVKNDLDHGEFEHWIQAEFDMNLRSAQRFMQVAERFRDKSKSDNLSSLSVSVIYELSSPSTPSVVADQVITGDIPPNIEAIKEASRKQKEAEKVAFQAKIDAENAKAQLGIFQAHSQLAQGKIDELSEQIVELEEKIKTIQTPEKVEVIPQETKDKIANLEALIKKLKEHSQNLFDENEKLVTDLRKQREANESRRKQEQYEAEVKNGWKKSTDTLYKALSQFVGSIPSPIAVKIFEGEEWARYDQLEQALKHFYEAFAGIKHARYSDQFVESAVTSVPAVVEG